MLYVLDAYLDESNSARTNDLGDICVIGGFLGTESAWKWVKEEWEEARKPFDHFHAAKFLRDKDYARQLSWEQKQKYLVSLAHATNHPELMPVVAAVREADYADFFTGELRERYTSKHMVCAQILVAHVLRVLAQSFPEEKIKFFFEENAKYRDEIVGLHKVIFDYTQDYRLVSITHVRKPLTLAEPADYYAYACFQQLSGRDSRESLATRPILGDGTVMGHVYDRDFLRKLAMKLRGQME